MNIVDYINNLNKDKASSFVGATSSDILIKKNIDASPETISFVSILSYCKPCQRLYNILVDIYINNSNKVNRSTAVMGILYNKGIIKDRGSIKESNDVISLRKKFKSEHSIEREKILEKFENGELTL